MLISKMTSVFLYGAVHKVLKSKVLKAKMARIKGNFYPNLPSALRPVPYAESIPVAVPKDNTDCMPEWESS